MERVLKFIKGQLPPDVWFSSKYIEEET